MILKVEPALFMFMFAYGVTIPIRTEYLRERFVKEAGLPVKHSSADCHINKSDPLYPTLEKINEKTAYWSVYLALTLSIPALFSSNYLCAVSDSKGRKLPMYITTVGFTIYAVLHMFVIKFNLSLHLLAVASFVLGCSGDFTTFVSCGFAYVADTTTLSKRILRIVIAETLITVSGGPGQVGSGVLIEKFGFEAPYILILGCMLITSLYLWWLPESVLFDDEQKGKSYYNPKEVLIAMKELLRPRPDGRFWKLISYNVIIFVYIMNVFGFLATSVLYITSGNPFCLSHQQVGFYEAAQFFSCGLGMFIGGALLPICLSDLTVIQMSNILLFASLLMTGFVRTEAGLYSATVLGLGRLLAVPISRARMSKLVDPSEQGVMFALSGCVQSVSTTVGIPALQAIFPSTNAIFPGMVFIIMAVTVIPPSILTIFLQVDERKRPLHYKSIPDEDTQESVNKSEEKKVND